MTNKELTQQLSNEREYTLSLIQQKSDSILIAVQGAYVSNTGFNEYKTQLNEGFENYKTNINESFANHREFVSSQLELKIGKDDSGQLVSMINAVANKITITSDYFTLEADGRVTATAGKIGQLIFEENSISSGVDGLTFLANGKILANTVEISDTLSSKVLSGRTTNSAKLYMEEKDVSTETVTLSIDTEIVDEGNGSIAQFDKGSVVVTLRSSKILSQSKSFTLDFSYKSNLGGIQVLTQVATINSGKDSTILVIPNWIKSSLKYASGKVTPSSIIQIKDTNTKAMFVEGNLSPYEDPYQLGSQDNKWSESWVKVGHYNSLYTDSGEVLTSDRERKNSISTLPTVYSDLFDRLTPVIFKFNENDSDRLHMGLIAQDVKQTLDELGIDTKDFATYCEWQNEGKTTCGIRYIELVPLLIHEVQKLKQKIGGG